MENENMDRGFYKILKSNRPDFAAHLDEIMKRGKEDWVDLLLPDSGSHAGFSHLQNVERMADQIVPDELKEHFSMGEIFLLLSTIFLHDIGKTIPKSNDPDRDCDRTIEKCPLCETEDKRKCTKPQWNHYINSEVIINAQCMALGLPDERIAEYSGLLAFCHGLKTPPTMKQPAFIGKNGKKCKIMLPKKNNYRTTSLAPYGILRIPLLASILRIADETDNSWTRALRGYWTQYQNQTRDNVGKAFRRCIEDIEFCHQGQCLILHVSEMEKMSSDPNLRKVFIDSINDARNGISNVLVCWHDELDKIGIHLKQVYIEYHNHLFKEFDLPVPNPRTGSHVYPPLCEVMDEKNKESVEKIFKAMIHLTIGSYGYSKFNWELLEAEIGRPLTSVDKWLVGRIADISGNRIVITEQGNLHLEFNRENASELQQLILGGEGE
jgi:hypothetical protein